MRQGEPADEVAPLTTHPTTTDSPGGLDPAEPLLPTHVQDVAGGEGEGKGTADPSSVTSAGPPPAATATSTRFKAADPATPTVTTVTWSYAVLVALVVVLSASLSHTILFWQYAAQLPTPLLRQTYGCDWRLADGHWSTYGGPAARSWVTDGCFAHAYQARDVADCLRGEHNPLASGPAAAPERRRIVFIGDSGVRGLFWGFVRLLGAKGVREEDQPRHANIATHREVGHMNVSLEFYWDPFLTSLVADHVFLASKTKDPFHFLVIGAGAWSLRVNTTQSPQLFSHVLSTLLRKLRPWEVLAANDTAHVPPPPTTFFRLVGPVVPSMLSSERQGLGDRAREDLYNRIILNRSTVDFDPAHVAQRVLLTSPYLVRELAPPGTTQDGLHYTSNVMAQEVQLMLNSVCNQRLFAGRVSTDAATCCVEKETYLPTLRTVLFFVVLAFCGPFAYVLHALAARMSNKQLQSLAQRALLSPKHALILTQLMGLLALMYVTDRTPVWDKANKDFSILFFTLPLLLALVVGHLSLEASKDESFLNRHQTDEWKGWMQLVILVYHWTGASKISAIYNFVRVLVAAYLFMTGYGHFIYFYVKQDFGVVRVLATLVRLNFLSILMSYTMERSLIFYYFGPMVSFWFLVIYATMRLGWERNKEPRFLLIKLGVSFLLVFVLLHVGFVELLFAGLRLVGVEWDAVEALFRLRLDLAIVYVGMLVSMAVQHVPTMNPAWRERARPWTVPACVVAIVGYMVVEYFTPKQVYNQFHFVASIFPILGFILLRNITSAARRTYSRFWAWVGGFSLETFLLQYHLWLAMDSKGILVLFPRQPIVNFVLGSVLLLAASEWVGGPVSAGVGEMLVNRKEVLASCLRVGGCLAVLLLLNVA